MLPEDVAQYLPSMRKALRFNPQHCKKVNIKF
jgi:hypothetical protein